ncbi:DNA alkylation repair protein [Rathayibacter sp. YIM 133350]|uniref:DNA alkylation repair protein n=1 Tax=Rathayibacter sp. YIM 133350 TaxID=3131992 RepID=UPI00307F3EF9
MTDAPPQTAAEVQAALAALGSRERAESSAWFFKTGPGEYGEGDLFVGVSVPQQRAVAKRFSALPLGELDLLLDSPVHEHRLTGVLIACDRFERASRPRSRDDRLREALADWYLAAVRRGRVDNWDIVDSSAGVILGGWLFDRPRDALGELVASPVLWEGRVGIIATQGFINRGDASTTLELAPALVADPEDLIRKAVGWMLREVGKRISREDLLAFLDEYAGRMSRTALSYATEHLPPEQRAVYRAMPRTP